MHIDRFISLNKDNNFLADAILFQHAILTRN